MSEVPEIEVHMVKSTDKIGGIGEPGVPPLAPAVANAVFNATGARIRRIPLTPQMVLAASKQVSVKNENKQEVLLGIDFPSKPIKTTKILEPPPFPSPRGEREGVRG